MIRVASRSWRDRRIDNLLKAVSDLGMTMSRASADEKLDERTAYVAEHMRVTEALRGMSDLRRSG